MTAFSFFPSPASAGYCRGGVPFSISFQGQPGPAGAALDGGKGFRSDVTAAPAALRQGEKVAAQEKRESSKAENIFPLLPLLFPPLRFTTNKRKRMRDSSGFRRPIPHGGCLIDLRDSSWRLISAFFSSTGGHCFTSQVLSSLHNSQFQFPSRPIFLFFLEMFLLSSWTVPSCYFSPCLLCRPLPSCWCSWPSCPTCPLV